MRVLIDGQTFATPDIHRGIGRVVRNLCNELLQCDRSRRWYITASPESDLDALDAAARSRVQVVDVPPPAPGLSRDARMREYSCALRETCRSNGIDLYWNPNPLMLNAVLPLDLSGPLRVCTVYDVIPARLPDLYARTWSEEDRVDYELRLAKLSSWADHLAFISRASAADFASLDPGAESLSSVIPIGVDHATFWASAAAPPETARPYLLLVGGADPRKNQERAIEAFGRAVARPDPRFERLRLRITGAFPPPYAATLRALARDCGVGGRVELLGRVSDERLAELYRGALALFFPSLYEGFGLPVVEAMSCGTALIVSDRPELRECAGPFATFCDPHDADHMAKAIAHCLEGRAPGRAQRAQRIARAREYGWERSAAEYAALFDQLGARAVASASGTRLRLGFATPWPPDRSGIAAYSFSVVEQLVKRADVEVFVVRPAAADGSLGVPIRPIGDLARDRGRFDGVISHLGNSSDYHREIYRLAWAHPGISVLHDFNIHPFLQHAYLGTADDGLYRDALAEGYGERGERHFRDVKAGRCEPDIWAFPGSAAIAARSLATIVHSDWVREQLGDGPDIFSIPHGAARHVGEAGELPPACAAVDAASDAFSIGVFGFQNAHKRIPSVLEACRRLRELGYPVHLLLVGAHNDPALRLDDEIAARGAGRFTWRTGYVDDAAYWACLDRVDVVVNLRHPSVGETSGALFRALGRGKACIVSDHAQYAELPDSVCWKVDTGESELDELVACLARLLREPELRAELGRNAERYVERYASWQRSALLYERVVRSVGRRSRVR